MARFRLRAEGAVEEGHFEFAVADDAFLHLLGPVLCDEGGMGRPDHLAGLGGIGLGERDLREILVGERRERAFVCLQRIAQPVSAASADLPASGPVFFTERSG
ncbi:MAG: hypothetical protein U0744_08965 [Gemmataceae bacterium]